jgi:hypothetical protein
VRRPIITFIIGLLVGVSLPFAFFRVAALVGGEEPRLYQSFAQIKADMPRHEVVRLMGSEGTRSDTFRLGQLAGYEFEYRAASHSGAAYFLSWHTGVDMVFTVAFDHDDKPIYKASGGT